jgi:hypothetical protein
MEYRIMQILEHVSYIQITRVTCATIAQTLESCNKTSLFEGFVNRNSANLFKAFDMELSVSCPEINDEVVTL